MFFHIFTPTKCSLICIFVNLSLLNVRLWQWSGHFNYPATINLSSALTLFSWLHPCKRFPDFGVRFLSSQLSVCIFWVHSPLTQAQRRKSPWQKSNLESRWTFASDWLRHSERHPVAWRIIVKEIRLIDNSCHSFWSIQLCQIHIFLIPNVVITEITIQTSVSPSLC